MPPFQVIDRQVDPSAQLALQTSQNIAENIQRKQAMQLTLMELKQKAKDSEDEAQKEDFAQIGKILEYSNMLHERGITGAANMKTIHDLYGEDSLRALGIGGSRFNEIFSVISNAPGSGEQQLKKEQAGTQSRLNAMLDKQASGGGAAAGASRGMVMSGVTPSGPTFTNLDAVEAEARTKASVDFEKNVGPAQQTYGAYRQSLANANAEIGSKVPEGALGAFVRGSSAKVASQIGKLPEVQAFIKTREATAQAIGSMLNGGRPTEPDRELARAILPDIDYPDATNEALDRFNQKLFSNPFMTENSKGARASRSVMLDSVNGLIKSDKKFVEAAIAKGHSMEEINATLQEIHKERGY